MWERRLQLRVRNLGPDESALGPRRWWVVLLQLVADVSADDVSYSVSDKMAISYSISYSNSIPNIVSDKMANDGFQQQQQPRRWWRRRRAPATSGEAPPGALPSAART